MNKHIIEVYDFTKNNITVRVEIDHQNNKISLLDSGYNKYYQKLNAKYKQWVFAERGVEYMQGWLNILEVMQEAIKDAKARYEKQHAEINRLKDKEMERIVKLASKQK